MCWGDTWVQEGGSKRRLEKTAKGRAAWFVLVTRYYLCYESRRMRWAWHIARMWEKTAGGKHERKRPLARTRRRWENNIKTDFKLERMAWNGFVCLTIGTSCGFL